MSAPFLSIAVAGQGSVSNDTFNTYEQTCDNVSQLRAFTGVVGMQVFARGIQSINDGGQGAFYWNANVSNPVDDNVNTIVPNASITGCWSRLTNAASAPIPTTASGSNAIVLTPRPDTPTITSYQNFQLFSFIAGASSTGNVTAQVETPLFSGTPLAALPVFLPNGSQAGAGSFQSGFFYMIAYVSSFNGFVIVSALPTASSVTTNIVTPQGRLTLVSGSPVMTGDAANATSVYYDPYIGGLIPLYSGSAFVNNSFSELTLNLDSNSGHTGYQASGGLFDLFVFNNSGSLALGTGPAWSTATARGSGAGTTQIQLLNGVWVNANTITLRFGNASGNTTSVAANQATYVGTMYATANGQTGMNFKPAGAAGGSANILGLYNAYNRVKTYSLETDSTSTWTYASTSWRETDASANNRVSFVDGLQQSFIDTYQEGVVTNSNLGNSVDVGVNLDSTSATPNKLGVQQIAVATQSQFIASRETFNPQLGFHYIQAMENTTGNTATFNGGALYGLIVSLDM